MYINRCRPQIWSYARRGPSDSCANLGKPYPNMNIKSEYVGYIEKQSWPTKSPTAAPSKTPTNLPSATPTKFPSGVPSKTPTNLPSQTPSMTPTQLTKIPTKITTKPTQAPTKTVNPTITPTQLTITPTEIPTLLTQTPTKLTSQPSETPTITPTQLTNQPSQTPTIAPTDLTQQPSKAPTKKPTSMPTETEELYIDPICPILIVDFLDQIFPVSQSMNMFSETNQYYNGRRIWTNGDIDIYYSDRFDVDGNWVVSNQSYTMVDITVDNANKSLPGVNEELYHHFSNDNPLGSTTDPVTIKFSCIETRAPSQLPTINPTLNPTKSKDFVPCSQLYIEYINDNCKHLTTIIQKLFVGKYIREDHPYFNTDNNLVRYYKLFDTETIEYTIFNKWGVYDHAFIDNTDGINVHYWILQNQASNDSLTPITSDKPYTWNVFSSSNVVSICDVNLTLICDETVSPSVAPTSITDVPSLIPTSLNPTQMPTMIPTSQIPTETPTISPTELCDEIKVHNTDKFNENYKYIGNKMYKSIDVTSDKKLAFGTDSMFVILCILYDIDIICVKYTDINHGYYHHNHLICIGYQLIHQQINHQKMVHGKNIQEIHS